jgi:hypothetical protein
MARKRKPHNRASRIGQSTNTDGLTTWKAPDSKDGVTRVVFPSFRVDPDDLAGVNAYCDRTGEQRSVLMRRLIREFLEQTT